jgi:hypothetical protein
LQTGLRLATLMWVSRMVAGKPRCIVIDDFHWIDPSSRVLMDIMIRMAADLPLVVLTGSRPPAMPDWAGMPHVEVIELGGLDQAATEELGTAVAGAALDTESARWLYQRTAGNALFVGEIMRTLREAAGWNRSASARPDRPRRRTREACRSACGRCWGHASTPCRRPNEARWRWRRSSA